MSILVAYDLAGNVVGTLDDLVLGREDGSRFRADFEAYEQSGAELRALWEVDSAVGSATWPERLGADAPRLQVELRDGRITALIDRISTERKVRHG